MLTVSELTGKIKRTIEDNFFEVQIIGELSNYKPHNSGHWYFSLKDSDAQISCTMWRSFKNYVFFTPQDGMKIIVTGKVTVYPPRGTYQIDVRSMLPAGEGDLQMAFEALKKRLFEEGLFDEAYKKPIPWMPERIGIATAIDGAALQDMIITAKKRFPLAELIVAPCKVQGAGASESVANAIRLLNKQGNIEVIIVARGGGSIEDLWAFNEESAARAIFDSRIPVVTGVGHEVDITIADFVADYRAATPTAAMEAVIPDGEELLAQIQQTDKGFMQYLKRLVVSSKTRLRQVMMFSVLAKPMQLVQFRKQSLDYTVFKFHENIRMYVNGLTHKVALLSVKVESNNVKKLLKKGFVLVIQHGKFVKRATGLISGEEFSLEFFDKTIQVYTDEKK
ncbi:MAG: exodeoxyribonuclease VII large subunit [Ignavibacteriales bacterium]|nr:exodeoxyribonuclease VII large subunit [Ignavibacteriales bacterium]